MSNYAGTALWLLVTLTAAVGSYTINLQVAGTRSRVADLREKLVADARAIRNLQAELRTRARLPEMQRWNDDVLKMSAPAAGQFLASPLVLAGFVPVPGAAAVEAPQARYAVTGPAEVTVSTGIVQASFGAPAVATRPVQTMASRPNRVGGALRQPTRDFDRTTRVVNRHADSADRPARSLAPYPAEGAGRPPKPASTRILHTAGADGSAGWTPNRPLAIDISTPIDLLPAGAR